MRLAFSGWTLRRVRGPAKRVCCGCSGWARSRGPAAPVTGSQLPPGPEPCTRKGPPASLPRSEEVIFDQGLTGPTAGNVLGPAVGQELGQTSAELIRCAMTVVPMIEIRPGYAFNVVVTEDLVFLG